MSDDHANDGPRSLLFMDNGGYHIKALYVKNHYTTSRAKPQFLILPNCVGASATAGKGIVGSQLAQLPQYHGLLLRRPVEKGYIVDGILQAHLWEYVLQYFGIDDESQVELWLTAAMGAPRAVANLLHTLFTKKFFFFSVTFVSSCFLSLLSYELSASVSVASGKGSKRPREDSSARDVAEAAASTTSLRGAGCALVVDAGFSGTTVVPYLDYKPVYSSIVRIDVGGKLLTNRLKQHLSYTQMNVMEDTWLVNYIKERYCEVVLEPRRALAEYAASAATASASGLAEVRHYLPTIPPLLPLGCPQEQLVDRLGAAAAASLTSARAGSETLQLVRLRHERFVVPELLFCPPDVGIAQVGLTQAIAHSVFQRGLLLHLTALRALLLSRVYIYGGTSNLPGFTARLEKELLAEGGALERQTEADRCLPVTPSHQHLTEGSADALAALSPAELQPLYGACLLCLHPAGAPHRRTVESRARVLLKGNKPDVEDFHGALLQLL